MKPGAKYVVAAVALLCAVIVAVGLNLILIDRTVANAQRQWCTTLDLITSAAARQAPARPLTKAQADLQRRYFAAMMDLKNRFGC